MSTALPQHVFVSRASIRVLLPFQLAAVRHDAQFDSLMEQALHHMPEFWAGLSAGATTHKVAHSEYMLEYHDHVRAFLFDGNGACGCHYLCHEGLQWPSPDADSSLRLAALRWEQKSQSPATPDLVDGDGAHRADRPTARGWQPLADCAPPAFPPAQQRGRRLEYTLCGAKLKAVPLLELWISRLGTGVLSITLPLRPVDNPAKAGNFQEDLIQLSHDLATGQKTVCLTSGESWFPDAKSPEAAACQGIDPSNPGHFVLNLSALLHYAMSGFRSIGAQLQFSQIGVSNCVVEFGEDVNSNADILSDPSIDRLLVRLAELQPLSHPGYRASQTAIGNRTEFQEINRQHISRMSVSGVAQAISWTREPGMSQPNPETYDAKRLLRAHTDYFVAWLVALLQRQCLLRLMQESALASDQTPMDAHQRNALTTRTVSFDLEADFTHASWRPALQEHYELARKTHRIGEGTASVRRAVKSFSELEANRQREETEEAMHGLETIIGTVYSVELAHVFGGALLGPPVSGSWSHLFAYLLVAALSFLTMRTVLHAAPSHSAGGHGRSAARIWATFVLLSVIQLIALGIQSWFHGH